MTLPDPIGTIVVGDNLPAALNTLGQGVNDLTGEVQGRIPFPSGAAFGDLLRWDGDSWETTETRFLEGTGRPEGQVAAPIGSRYIDKAGAQGAVEWVKRSGEPGSNTGWLCLAGDTGPRDISALVTIGNGTLFKAILVRSGQVVELHLDINMPGNQGSNYAALTLPAGFRPQYDRYGALTDNKEGADTRGTLVTSTGAVSFLGVVAGKRDRYSGNWITANAWPSSLPGSAL